MPVSKRYSVKYA